MKIKTLTLDNFQGIKHKEFDFNGQSASIYGDNATGKTTVFNAFTWLLFDRPSTGAKNFTPKMIGTEGVIHNIENSVTATFVSDSGKVVTYRKVFREIWKHKRGSAVEEFDGNTTDYYINGVPSTLSEYKKSVADNFGNAEQMMILSMPDYFSDALGWQDRRTILLKVCGGISDREVILSNPDLAELPSILANGDSFYTVDEYRKIATAKRTEINKQLGMLPDRIDEAQRACPDVSELSKDDIQAKIADANKRKDALIADRVSGNAKLAGELSAKVSDLKAELSAKRYQYESVRNEAIRQYNEAEAKAKSDIAAEEYKLGSLKGQLVANERETADLYQQRNKLVDEIKQVRAMVWKADAAVCPLCGQELPKDKIAEKEAEFNREKSEKLEQLTLKGQTTCNKQMIEDSQSEHALIQQSIADTEQKIAALKAIQITTRIIPNETPFEKTEEGIMLTAQIESTMKRIEDIRSSERAAETEVNAKIRTVDDELRYLQDELMKFTIAENQSRRVEELKAQERTLGDEFAKVEQGIYLCDLFTKTMVAMLDEKINGRFKSVRFRLFIEQINGGLRDDCEVLIPSADGTLVPYAFANNAARINAGLEIISVLSSYWNITMPVFIDNAESVTHLNQLDTQVIRLVVDESAKSLILRNAD